MSMDNLFNIGLNPQTKFLLSTSGSQSSIERYNKALKKLGLNLVYFTFPHTITAEQYAGLLKSPIIQGGAVTGKGGLKSTIIPYLDEVEELALKTKAVNTVVNKEGKLFGYNTDTFGLKHALQKGLADSKETIRTAVIYGNGGVSGVAFHVLQELGLRVTMVGRNPQKVAAKRKELQIEDIPHFEGPYDLVVDATPISSNPDFLQAAGFSEILENCKMVFCHNMPEKDGKKNFLEEYCVQKAIEYIPGKWMHSAQLVKQYSLLLSEYNISESQIKETW
jgi:shikimate dehydrogenase